MGLALAAGSYAAWDYQRVSPLYQPAPGGNAAPLWARAQASWLFADAVDFARLTTTPVTAANAAQSYALAQRLRAKGRLTGKQIVVAAMRKLLVICFGVLKTGKPFDAALASAR